MSTAKDFIINVVAKDQQARQVIDSFKTVAIGAAAGIAAGWAKAKIGEAITGSMETGQAQSRLNAELSTMPADAARYGKLAGEVWAKGFTGELPEVNRGLSSVRRNMGSLADTEMAEVTAEALAIADVFEQDVNKATGAAGALMRNDLAPSARAAMDVIAAGLQSNANQADDLLDTFTEYSPFFKKLGLDGKESLGILNQGMAAGARNSDFLADALKEFTIRGQEPVRRSTAETAAAMKEAQRAGLDLARAQRSEVQAQQDLNAARQQAVRDLANLAEQLRGAELSERGAALAVERAKHKLTEIATGGGNAVAAAEAAYIAATSRMQQFGGNASAGERQLLQDAVDRAKEELDAARSAPSASGLDSKEAQLAYDEAVYRYEQQKQQTVDLAAEKAEADRAGVDGSRAVRSAQESLAQAQQGVTDATQAATAANAAAADDSTALGKAYRRLGIDGEWAANAIATGGPEAQRALQMVRDGLLGVTDPVERNALAVQFFGTKAEDLQGALYAMDPSTATDALGQVEGAADSVTGALDEGPLTRVEQMKRGWQSWLSEIVNTQGPMGEAAAWFAAFGGDIAGAAAALGPLALAIITFRGAQVAATAATAANTAATTANNVAWYASPVTWIIAAIIVAIGLLIAAGIWLWQNWDSVTKWIGEAWSNLMLGFSVAGQWASDWFQGFLDKIGEGGKWLGGKIDEIVQWFTSIPQRTGEAWTGLLKIVGDVVRNIQNTIIDVWNMTLGGKSFNIPIFGQVNFPKFANIPALATGGIVTGPTLALIGEAGTEAVVPLSESERYGFGGGDDGGDTVVHNVLKLDGRTVYESVERHRRKRR